MKEELINKAYEIAKERYAAVGVDTEKVMETMQNFHLSLHCWQADDVTGFEVQAGSLTGGCHGLPLQENDIPCHESQYVSQSYCAGQYPEA